MALIHEDDVKFIVAESLDSSKCNPILTDRQMKSCFGVDCYVFAMLWNRLVTDNLVPDKGTTKHLLWALAFLKTYETDPVLSSMYKCSRNTLMKWKWMFVTALSLLDIVSKLRGAKNDK
jgi:hypothetical protein